MFAAAIGKVGPLKVGNCQACTEVIPGQCAIVEKNRDHPRDVWWPTAVLLRRPGELRVHRASSSLLEVAGEARNVRERLVLDSVLDTALPDISRPEVTDVPPDRNARALKSGLKPVDQLAILAHVREEDMAAARRTVGVSQRSSPHFPATPTTSR